MKVNANDNVLRKSTSLHTFVSEEHIISLFDVFHWLDNAVVCSILCFERRKVEGTLTNIKSYHKNLPLFLLKKIFNCLRLVSVI